MIIYFQNCAVFEIFNYVTQPYAQILVVIMSTVCFNLNISRFVFFRSIPLYCLSIALFLRDRCGQPRTTCKGRQQRVDRKYIPNLSAKLAPSQGNPHITVSFARNPTTDLLNLSNIVQNILNTAELTNPRIG